MNFADLKNMFTAKRAALGTAIASAAASVPASATIVTDAQTAISAASADALTVGGYVVAAVGALIVITLVLKLMGKV